VLSVAVYIVVRSVDMVIDGFALGELRRRSQRERRLIWRPVVGDDAAMQQRSFPIQSVT